MSLVEVDSATANRHGVDVRDITISEVHGYYAYGTLTPRMLTRCYLECIHSLNPYLGAVLAINRLATSFVEADTSLPLYGIPILIKDNIAADNMQTTAGSFFLHDIKPKQEALVIQRLRKQGAIILGKTNLSELSGFLSYDTKAGFSHRGGFTRNPYNVTSDFCGSSTGSAAAVAANLAMAALGTDTLGSITTPASVTALYGYRPTFDPSLTQHVIPLAKSMDTVGVVARTATDCAIIARAITSNHFQSNASSLQGIRIGVFRAHFSTELELKQHYSRMKRSFKYLKQEGATIVTLPGLQLPKDYTSSVQIHMVCEFGQDIQEYLKNDVIFGPNSLSSIRNVSSIIEWYENHPLSKNYSLAPLRAADPKACSQDLLSYPNYHQATRTNLTHLFKAFHLQAIAIPSDARALGFYMPSVAGYPAINIPMGYRPDGSSLGMLLYGSENSDVQILHLAQTLQRSGLFRRRRPKFLG